MLRQGPNLVEMTLTVFPFARALYGITLVEKLLFSTSYSCRTCFHWSCTYCILTVVRTVSFKLDAYRFMDRFHRRQKRRQDDFVLLLEEDPTE
jgi:hypothetical protein